MKYKNYTARVVFDEKARIFHGEVVDLADTITFQSNRADRLEGEFRKSVNEYLAFCKQMGRTPEKPFSGRFVLRIPQDLHRRLYALAAEADKSLNELIVEKLDTTVHHPISPEHQINTGSVSTGTRLTVS